jgi:hypothetical protein
MEEPMGNFCTCECHKGSGGVDQSHACCVFTGMQYIDEKGDIDMEKAKKFLAEWTARNMREPF